VNLKEEPMLPAYPKPSQIKIPRTAVRVLMGGKEQCNLLTKEGRDEYQLRKRIMWERQGRVCCLHGHIASCPGKLSWADAVFAHEIPRGHGGGSHDDRIEVDGKRQNGAAHSKCNYLQGSRRIAFNAAYNITIWEKEDS
jgi:hypothetical protein